MQIYGLDLLWKSFVPQICQQFGSLVIQTSVNDIQEQTGFSQVLQINVVYISYVRQAMIFRIFHVQDTIDHFPLGHCFEN